MAIVAYIAGWLVREGEREMNVDRERRG